MLVLGWVKVEYVATALLRPHGSRRRSLNSLCGSKVEGEEVTSSLAIDLASLDVAWVKPWLP